MDEMICAACRKPILAGPVAWDPEKREATPLGGEKIPRRREQPALYALHEREGRQLMMGEPHIALPNGGRCHERCLTT